MNLEKKIKSNPTFPNRKKELFNGTDILIIGYTVIGLMGAVAFYNTLESSPSQSYTKNSSYIQEK